MKQITAKIFGWAQFALITIGELFAHGLPTSVAGWVTLLGSLTTAIGVHAASSTDGAK